VSRLGAVLERKAQTVTHSNPQRQIRGRASGTSITFGFKFISEPEILLTPVGATSGCTAGVVTIDKTGDYWTGCTIVTTNCTSVSWQATGVCIVA
jgi:hypothetical protein